jgi:DNA-binding response OmpR family regulator
MDSFKNLQVLVIASAPGLRSNLRHMLGNFGFNTIQFAVAATAAVRRLRQQPYDLILCDHELGDGQDGQHLLEDLRQHAIIPRESLFVMITAERNYERVISTAELQPDDYILTPLAAGALHTRLTRIVDRREAFIPAWKAMESGDWLSAIDYCTHAEDDFPQYVIDFLRLKAELQHNIGQLNEAETTYREIFASTSQPWAKLGLAQTLALKKSYPEADALLTELITENDHFMAAYDLLAQVRTDSGQRQAACSVLKTATGHSPYCIGRQRQLGDLALSVGDAATAETVLNEVVQQSAKSDFRDPEDHVRLVQAQLGQNKLDQARATIKALESNMGKQPKAELCTALANAMVHAKTGDSARARTDFATAVKLSTSSATLSVGLAQEVVKSCFAQQLGDVGSEMALNLLRVAGDERTVESTRELLRTQGLEALSQRIEAQIQEEVRQLLTTGAERARADDYDGAVAAMMDAARRMPGHPIVIFNAALALLRHIERRGWNKGLAQQARTLIERARELAPANERIAELAEFMHLLIERERIRPHAESGTAPKRRGARR